MSVKSLLQAILFLLIILILGSIYFIYFYSKPVNKNLNVNENINEINKKPLTQEVILEDLKISEDGKEDKIEDDNLIDKKNNDQINSKNIPSNSESIQIDKIENLTKEIEYITTNKNGDVFKISAKYGKTNIENTSLLDLEKVDGIISSNKRSQINITSDYAIYNYDNQNSKFFGNVKVTYDNKIITCGNLDLIISDNIAVAYDNVIVKDEKSLMKAQVITLDILTKDININSKEKIKIFKN